MTDPAKARPQQDAKIDPDESRNEYQRDADRVLYSSGFRRLSGVTQVVTPGDEYVHHDRLTHSLKVAQVAQRLAGPLGPKISPEVVHTAALAHDIGHPPFGHAAEQELMAILDGRVLENGLPCKGDPQPILEDAFEGNAQSFRIVNRIAARKSAERGHGLNLTYRTLAAIAKYPWHRGGAPEEYQAITNTKWSAYESEADDLTEALSVADQLGLKGPHRSVEADIMDWADDVSYAVHDTEDFFRAGLIPLDQLRHNDELWKEFTEFAEVSIRARKVHQAVVQHHQFVGSAQIIRVELPSAPYAGDTASREDLHSFGSTFITTLTQDVGIGSLGELEIDQHKLLTVEILKKLTTYFVIDRPDLIFRQHGQRRIVRELYFNLYRMAETVYEGKKRAASTTLPSRFNDYCLFALRFDGRGAYEHTSQRLARATVDFICSLTDRQAAGLAYRLTGQMTSSHSMVAVL
jgi:dGTPase